MFPRKQLDWSWALFFRGLFYLFFSEKKKAQSELKKKWGNNALFLLSIRTGWDAFLESVDWEKGSVVLMSAITIPHMRDLVVEHGYTPIGVDLNMQTLEVGEEDLISAIEEHKPKAFVFAHLLGSFADLKAIKNLCQKHDVILVEDCAQSFNGVNNRAFLGDIAMYSFGTIKTSSALGGAVICFKDPTMRAKVQNIIASYPLQKQRVYAKKLLTSALFLILSKPFFFGLLSTLNPNYDAFIRRASRGFSGDLWLKKLRHQPGSALLKMLAHRHLNYSSKKVLQREECGEEALTTFQSLGLDIVGSQARSRTHWLLCLQVQDPDRVVIRCRALGFDLTRGSSVMISIGGSCATQTMKSIVYIPCYSPLGKDEYRVIAGVIRDIQN